jgi:hypothetical protein
MAPVNKTAMQCVMEVDHERIKLEAEAERLASLSNDDGKIIQNCCCCWCCFPFSSENEQLTKSIHIHV